MLGLADRTRVIDLFEALMRGDIAAALDELRDAIRHRRRSRGGAGRSRRVHAFRHPREGRAGGRRRSALIEVERTRGRGFAEKLSMRVLSRTWQMLLKGIAEVQDAGRPLAAAEMVLVRIAYAADLPTPDEVIRSLEAAAPAGARSGGGVSVRRRAPRGVACALRARRAYRRVEPSRGAPRAALAPAMRADRRRPGRQPSAARRRRRSPFRGADRARREKRDLGVKLALERDVRLVRCEDGRLEIALEPSAAQDAGQRSGAQVLAMDQPALDGGGVGRAGRADRQIAGRARGRPSSRRGVRADPLVQAVLARFPGAEIVDVRKGDERRAAACRRPIPTSGGTCPMTTTMVRRSAPWRRTASTTTLMPSAKRRSAMADFLGLMKQAAELKSKMEAMQAELDQIEVEGTAGGGLVTVKLSGKGELKGVKIDDSLLKPQEKEIVEDLIVAAHRRRAAQGRGAAAGQDEERHRRPAAAARPEAVLKIADAASSGGPRWRTWKKTSIEAVGGDRGPGVSRADLPVLVQEGVVDKDRFTAYLETAMAEMAPGIEDKRTVQPAPVDQRLRTPLERPCSSVTGTAVIRRRHADRRRRTRDRAPDPAARPPAGARPALGAARRAVSHQEARADHGAARRGHADGAGEDRDLPRLRQYRHPEPRARSAPTRGATPRSSWWSPTSPTCGRSSARTRSTRAITCSAARCRRSTASARRT